MQPVQYDGILYHIEDLPDAALEELFLKARAAEKEHPKMHDIKLWRIDFEGEIRRRMNRK